MIKIKTKIDSLTYELTEHVIKKKNHLFSRIFKKKPKYEEYKIAGSPVFQPITLIIKDEIDKEKWLKETYNGICNKYKKDLQVKDKIGNIYTLKGCFPVSWCRGSNEVKICYDFFTVN